MHIKYYYQIIQKISVRENSAIDLLNKWEIPCIGQVLDSNINVNKRRMDKVY